MGVEVELGVGGGKRIGMGGVNEWDVEGGVVVEVQEGGEGRV